MYEYLRSNEMKYAKSFILNFIFRQLPIILLYSCISPFDFSAKNQGGQVVITGQVSSMVERSEIQLGITAEGRLPYPISGAIIQLNDQMGNSTNYDERAEGVYALSGFTGKPGSTYHIKVILPTGEVYESVPEKMPEYTGTLTVSHDFVEEIYTDSEGANVPRRVIKIYAATSLPPEWKQRFLHWTVEEVYLLSPTDFPDVLGNIPPPCFVTQKAEPNRIALFDGRQFNSTEIQKELICSRAVDRTFLEKHYFNTYQSSITEEAHAYWNKVNILANQTGSIFDTPPAQIKGNVFNVNNPTEKVLGCFQATHETSQRFSLLPSDFPYRVFFPDVDCTFYGDKYYSDYPSYCLDCLSLRNSSYKRPDWF